MRDLNFMLNGPLGFFIFVALTTFLFGSAPSYVPELRVWVYTDRGASEHSISSGAREM